MTTLLKLDDAYKGYGDRNLLDGTCAEFGDDHKTGFIGRNGAGKSTLIRILLGEEELDKGTVQRHPRLRLGYLRQHDPFLEGESVLDFLMRDSGQPDWRCGAVAGQFEIKGAVLEGPVKKLSGGWQTRVKLTALLLHEPNLLLLDEPTNFLDLRTQLLLEDFLKDFQGGCVIVSHDRGFLNATCDHTLSLSRGKLTLYPGKVDAFLEYEQQQREHDERSNAIIAAKREQLETFIAKNRSHANTAVQAKSKAKQLEKLQFKEIERSEKTVRMKVPYVEPRTGTALRCTEMSIGYPEHTVASGINVEILHGTRVAVVGDNGQGKTTFLRTVAGSLQPLAGSMKWGFNCDIGCYAQHVYTTLPEHYTVREYLSSRATKEATAQTILDMAGSFLFRGDDVDKPIEVLSGGERARLCMAGLLLGKHSVLILDEPGNHLDVETVESLAEALNRYQGTVIFTSHDRSFMERMATAVVEVRDGSVTNYIGDYASYLYRVRKEIEEGHRGESKPRAAAAVPETEQSKAERKARNRKLFDLRTQLQSVERQMTKYTEKKKSIEEQLHTVTDAAETQRLKDEHIAVVEKLAGIEERWLALEEEQAKVEATQ
ncbi:MAG TPA: ATP-binding cassette domain-containing protein [Planctomycetota bacterium]|nr:ATP-binding cassette domain-containing protein [Planctomycetota bacterium]